MCRRLAAQRVATAITSTDPVITIQDQDDVRLSLTHDGETTKAEGAETS